MTQEAPRLSGQAIFGLLLLVAAIVVRRVFAIPDYHLDDIALAKAQDAAAMGGDISDLLIAFGAPLVGWARSLPTIKPPNGGSGNALTALLVGLGLGGLTLAIPGCASREVVTAEPIAIEYWEGPPCRVHILDGGETPIIVRNPAGSDLRCRVVGER